MAHFSNTKEIPATKVGVDDLIKSILKPDEGEIFLILIQPDAYPSIISRLSTVLYDKEGTQGIYVTITLPHNKIASLLGHEQLSRRIIFIDAITKSTVGKTSAENCRFLDGPEDIAHLSYTLETLIKEMEGKKTFVLIDSLTSLLIHNSKDSVMKFSHHIVSKLRSHKCRLVFLALEEGEHRAPLNFLSFLSDKTFRVI